ncbi:MAG: PAS domain-containing protein, partial [Rhodospirillaceae bacterium]|nr:PAS domain-containing protein [Rhodospirillaceae bacterium]
MIEAGQITSPRVAALHRYWQSKCRDGSLPLRAAIDPTEIPRLLPYLVLAEIERRPCACAIA